MDTPHRCTILTVPGLGGSGPDHWQSRWERERHDAARAELGLWDRPLRNVWISRLDQAVRQATGPVELAAHSLGCIAVAWWARLSPLAGDGTVAGALLVAPADVDRAGRSPRLATFAPCPETALPFPAIVVASRDDPWMRMARSCDLAAAWGARLVDAGARGHLNAESGLAAWDEGQALLEQLVPERRTRRDGPAAPHAAGIGSLA